MRLGVWTILGRMWLGKVGMGVDLWDGMVLSRVSHTRPRCSEGRKLRGLLSCSWVGAATG